MHSSAGLHTHAPCSFCINLSNVRAKPCTVHLMVTETRSRGASAQLPSVSASFGSVQWPLQPAPERLPEAAHERPPPPCRHDEDDFESHSSPSWPDDSLHCRPPSRPRFSRAPLLLPCQSSRPPTPSPPLPPPDLRPRSDSGERLRLGEGGGGSAARAPPLPALLGRPLRPPLPPLRPSCQPSSSLRLACRLSPSCRLPPPLPRASERRSL
mmetsp:Transcript_97781/g.280946  ORF Transcript_97781/g.280946 Transcript_97781/m.280946 type:complete len:211 (+) Transcript_97781:806-1438(+)